jgi:adenylate cyclase
MDEHVSHTFLFADLAGFTALTEAHGDQEAAELAADYCEHIRGLLQDHEAEEVKTIGDAMMIRGRDPGEAIRLGLEIVETIGARPQFPIVRVGMHTGAAVEQGGDWFGAAVNLAARISAEAGGDEILISAETYEAAGEIEGVEFQHHGEKRFKNVADPVVIYRAIDKSSERGEQPIDPVCRMSVELGQAAGSLTHAGRDYHFCSLECVRAFANDPEQYVES